MTTSSSEAADAYEKAVIALLAGRAESAALAATPLEHDPDLALAWILAAISDRVAGRVTEAWQKIGRARECIGTTSGSPREDSVVRFFEHFGRDNVMAERIAIEHLKVYPHDHLIVMYTHFLYNLFLAKADRRDRHAGLVRSLAREWPADDWYLTGELCFVESEAGNHERALELGRTANEIRPDAASIAHGLSHALLETGRAEEGQQWLGTWIADFGEGGNQTCHLIWHQSLFALAAGDEARVVQCLDRILDFSGRNVSALSDGASLLWRLHLDGAPLGTLPWQALADVSSPPGYGFGNFHRGLVLGGLGDVDGLRSYAPTVPFPASEACLAIADFVSGAFGAAADRLLDNTRDLVAIGGSRAQLEILDDTLIAALAQAGRRTEACRRLATRLQARASVRDDRWLAALSA